MKDGSNVQGGIGVLLMSMMCAGCYGAHETPVGAVGEQEAPLSFEEFEDQAFRDPQGGYVVDGDIFLSDTDELRDYYDSWYDDSTSLTVNQVFNTDDLWAFPDGLRLTYCVSDDFDSQKDELLDALASATQSWRDVVAVRFEHLGNEDDSCDNTNTDVVFDVSPAPGGATYFARAFFPSDSRDDRSLLVNGSAFTTSSGGRDLDGILRHELGHALGFRHEHIWLTPQCTGEGFSNARLVNSYDVDSVMHYPQCRPSGTGGYRQTQLDYQGAVSLYGLSPQLIMAAGGA